MEGDREDLCGPKGRHQVERPAWRGGSVASQVTLGGRQVAVPRLRVRSADGEESLPSAATTDPLDEHTLAAVAAGVSTRRYAHLGPGAGRGDGAGDVEQRGVSAVRGAVGQAPAVVSQPAVARAGPAGGLHRRQGLPGPLHGGRVGDRHAGPQARAWTARRGHRDGGRRQRPAQRSGHARPADGPDVAVRHRRRAGAAPGHHRCVRFPRGGATVPSTQAAQRARPSARTAARFGRQGVAGCLGPRVSGPRGARVAPHPSPRRRLLAGTLLWGQIVPTPTTLFPLTQSYDSHMTYKLKAGWILSKYYLWEVTKRFLGRLPFVLSSLPVLAYSRPYSFLPSGSVSPIILPTSRSGSPYLGACSLMLPMPQTLLPHSRSTLKLR